MIRQCSNCGEREIPLRAGFCPTCGGTLAGGYPSKTDHEAGGIEIQPRLLLAIAGSILLFIGVFTPIITLPIVGSMNYFQNGRGDGVIVLVLAVFSFVLTIAHKYRFLLFTGGGSLAILAFTFFLFEYRMSEMQSTMKSSLANNPFAGLGETLMNSIQLSWGWAVLVVGAGCLIASALLNRSRIERADGEAAIDDDSRFSDQAVWIILGLILVGWLAFVIYNYLSDDRSVLRRESQGSTNNNLNYGKNSESVELEDARTRARKALDEAANSIQQQANQMAANLNVSHYKLASTPQGHGATVISENANFRSTPDNFGEIREVIPYGEEVEVIKQHGPWFHVRYRGSSGWVHGNTIKLDVAY